MRLKLRSNSKTPSSSCCERTLWRTGFHSEGKIKQICCLVYRRTATRRTTPSWRRRCLGSACRKRWRRRYSPMMAWAWRACDPICYSYKSSPQSPYSHTAWTMAGYPFSSNKFQDFSSIWIMKEVILVKVMNGGMFFKSVVMAVWRL